MDKVLHRAALAALLGACGAAERPPRADPDRPPTLTLALGGDVMFGRVTADGWREHPADELDEFAPTLRAADVAFANLETGICADGRSTSKFPILRAPADRLDKLVDAGIDVVSIANNHVLDCGPDGIEQTSRAVTQRGIAVAGPDPARVGDVVVMAATMHRAPYARHGLGVIVADDSLPHRVRELRNADPSSLLVVSLHWGRERSLNVAAAQRAYARSLIDAGANVVAGHGSHTRQEHERHADGIIFYSLGNLAFDDRTPIGGPVPPQTVRFTFDRSRWRASE